MNDRYRSLLLFLTLALGALACGFPSPSQAPTAIAPAATEPLPLPTEPPPTAAPAADIAAVVAGDGQVKLYRLDGTLAATWDAPGIDWPRPDTVQVVGSSVYYINDAPAVTAVSEKGVSEFAYTATPNLTAFTVSPDEESIAWSTSTFGEAGIETELWRAAIDGTGMEMVASSEPGDAFPEYFALEPVAFGSDGRLAYAWQITGIGGYILFFGYSSLYAFDPATSVHTPLAPLISDSTGPCWSGVRSDLAFAVGYCQWLDGGLAMRERNLSTGVETVFPTFPEQGQAGAGVYSPSGNRLAYAIARSNPDDEAGQIIVRLSPDAAPAPIASIANGYAGRLFWLDEDRLLVGGMQNGVESVFLVGLDGILTKVADGSLAGWMRLP
ncbi:MAG TPA: hypothetical protein VLD63_12735 [Anaerolineales bacterium]|nr:hypothetical protein [Anaerolineales bacterium]